jgi:hypothetical protein
MRFDFSHSAARLARIPPYYRIPTVPVDPAFFRREGPLQWTGAVIRTHLEENGMDATPYRDEPTITVRYDHLGFRNENRTPEWEIAVAGDSFVELGHLPFGQLHTTLLGEMLQNRVLNLGASFTGPFSHLKYLEDYGISRATRHVLIVFYEGNDVADLNREQNDLIELARSGTRPLREPRRQTSLLRALGEKWRNRSWPSDMPAPPQINASYRGRDGERPLSLTYRLEPGSDLAVQTQTALERLFVGYSELARTHGIEAWVIYMPGKTRALEGQFRWVGSTDNQTLTVVARELPSIVADGCRRYSIHFLDLTPALLEEGRRSGELLYNDVFDTHLNAKGSAVVARALAEALKAPTKPDSLVEPAEQR